MATSCKYGSFIIQTYEAMKDEANASFRNKDMEKAEEQYLDIISQIEALGTPEELLQIYLAALNNIAATLLQLKKVEDVVVYTSKSVSLDTKNIKAYYRRAMARKDLNPPQYDSALEDVEKILEVETANSQALALKKTLCDLRIRNAQSAGPRKDPTALGSGSHTGSLAATAGMSTAPAPEPEVADLASEYGSFTVRDWTPPEPTKPAPMSQLPAAARPGATGPTTTATGATNIMNMIQARKKATGAGAKAGAGAAPQTGTGSMAARETAAVEGNEVVSSVFELLREEEARTKHVFKKKIGRNKQIEKTVVAKPGSNKKKGVAQDPHKLHNQPDRFAEHAVDAWAQLGSDETSKSDYVKQLLQERKRMEQANLKRAAYVKKTEDEAYSESDEDE